MVPRPGRIAAFCWIALAWSNVDEAAGGEDVSQPGGSPSAEVLAEFGLAPPGAASAAKRLREGSKITDQAGEFQRTGDHLQFVLKDGSGSLRILENLTLERVMRMLEDNPSLKYWSVSGTVTEFRGENYLLLTRAVLKSRGELNSRSSARSPRIRVGW